MAPLPDGVELLQHSEHFARIDARVYRSTEYRALSSGGKIAYVTLSIFMNQERKTWWISVARLAEEQGCSVKHMRAKLTELVNAGLIARQTRMRQRYDGWATQLENQWSLLDPPSLRATGQVKMFPTSEDVEDLDDDMGVQDVDIDTPDLELALRAELVELRAQVADLRQRAAEPVQQPERTPDREAGNREPAENAGSGHVNAEPPPPPNSRGGGPENSGGIRTDPSTDRKAKLSPSEVSPTDQSDDSTAGGSPRTPLPELPIPEQSSPPPPERGHHGQHWKQPGQQWGRRGPGPARDGARGPAGPDRVAGATTTRPRISASDGTRTGRP